MSGITKFNPTIADVIVLMTLFQDKIQQCVAAVIKNVDIESSPHFVNFVKNRIVVIMRSLDNQIKSRGNVRNICPSSLANLLMSNLWG